jgi:hypothetical protein
MCVLIHSPVAFLQKAQSHVTAFTQHLLPVPSLIVLTLVARSSQVSVM